MPTYIKSPEDPNLDELDAKLDDMLETKYGLGTVKKFRESLDENADFTEKLNAHLVDDADKGAIYITKKLFDQKYKTISDEQIKKSVSQLFPAAQKANKYFDERDMNILNEVTDENERNLVGQFVGMIAEDSTRAQKLRDKDRGTMSKVGEDFSKAVQNIAISTARTATEYGGMDSVAGVSKEDWSYWNKLNEQRYQGRKPTASNLAEDMLLGTTRIAPQAMMAMIGGPLGRAAFWQAQMVPDVLDEMRERGVDDKIGKPLAFVTTMAMVLLEEKMFQGRFKSLFGNVEDGIQRGLWNAVKNKTLRFGTEVGKNVLEENGQELAQVLGVSVGRVLDENADKFSKQDLVDLKSRLANVTEETLKSVPGLMLTGEAIQIARDLKTPRMKDSLLTPEGVDWFTRANPEGAEAIAKAETPSRKVFQEVFGKKENWNQKEREAFHAAMQEDNAIKQINAGLINKQAETEKEQVVTNAELEANAMREAYIDAETEIQIEEAKASKEAEVQQRLAEAENVTPEDLADLTPEEQEAVDNATRKGYNTMKVQKQIREENPYVFSMDTIKQGIQPPKVATEASKAFFNKYPRLKAKGKSAATANSADQVLDQIKDSMGDAGASIVNQADMEAGGGVWNVLSDIIDAHNKFNEKSREQASREALLGGKLEALKEVRKAAVEAELKPVDKTKFSKPLTIMSNINQTFKRHENPQGKGMLAENHALNEADKVGKLIESGKITPAKAAARLEKALSDATEFAKEAKKPAQRQEETLFPVADEGELDLGDTASVEEKPVTEPKTVEKAQKPSEAPKTAPETKVKEKATPDKIEDVPDSAQIRAYLKMAVSSGDLIRTQKKKGGKVTYEALNNRGVQTLKEVEEMRKQARNQKKVKGFEEDTQAIPKAGAMSMVYDGDSEMERQTSSMNVGEMVRLLKDAGIDAPSIYLNLSSKALGQFSTRRMISLKADIFLGPVINTGLVDTRAAKTITKPTVEQVTKELIDNALEKYPKLTEADLEVKVKAEPKRPGMVRVTLYRVDPNFAAKITAHEIGHWVDSVPDNTLSRGNILGRLATMQKFMKTTLDNKDFGRAMDSKVASEMRTKARNAVGKPPSKVSPEYGVWKSKVNDKFAEMAAAEGYITSGQLTQELKDLTKWWNPFNEDADPKYTKYRYSSQELYAEALSVLLNNPGELRSRAPLFYATWFQLLERKPEVKRAYEETVQEIVSGVSGDKMLDSMYKGFNRAEEEKRKVMESRKQKSSIITEIGTAFLDKFWVLHRAVARTKKTGNEFADPRLVVDRAKYTGSQISEYTHRNHAIAKDLETANVSEEDFGVYLMHQRHMNAEGEGGKRAIPIYGDMAGLKKADNAFRERMGEEKIDAMEKARKKFRKARQDLVLSRIEETHPFGKEFIEFIKNNEYYSRNEVVDYIDKKGGLGEGLKIFERIGTLKEINNPWMATMAADTSLIWAMNWNHAKRAVGEFLSEHGEEGQYEEAEKRWNGVQMAPVAPSDRNMELVTYMDDGNMEGYYTDKHLANAFKGTDESVQAIAGVLRIFSQPARLWFTTVRPGFQVFNAFFRDPARTWRNIGGNPFKLYLQLLKSFGPVLKDMKTNDEKSMREMRERGLLVHFGQMSEQDEDTKQLERILGEYKDKVTWRNAITKPFSTFWNAVLTVGSIGEDVNKLAAFTFMNENKEALGLTDDEINHRTRHWAGSPSFITGGSLTPISNNLFLFSNAALQGWRSDIEAFKSDPAGVGMRTLATSIMPKIAIMGLATGAVSAFLRSTGADDDDKLLQWADAQQRILSRVSEYDLANYHVIPIGMTKGDKAVYLRLPVDETSRVIGGFATKLFTGTNALESIQDAARYMGDQGPGWNPAFTMGQEALTYLTGGNPYDDFREKSAVPERIREAGGKESHKIFGKWLWNRYGGSFVYKFSTDNPTEIKSKLEKFLKLPFAGDLVGRFIRVSDYGISQKIEKEKKEARSIDTRKSIAVDKAVRRELSGERLSAEDKQLLGEEKTAADRRRKSLKTYGGSSLERALEWSGSASERAAVLRKFIEVDGKTKDVLSASKSFIGQQLYNMSTPKPEKEEGVLEWEATKKESLENIKGLPGDAIEAFEDYWFNERGFKRGTAFWKRRSAINEALKKK